VRGFSHVRHDPKGSYYIRLIFNIYVFPNNFGIKLVLCTWNSGFAVREDEEADTIVLLPMGD